MFQTYGGNLHISSQVPEKGFGIHSPLPSLPAFPAHATMSVPGLVYASSSLTSPLSPSTSSFNKWYNEVHIPDVLSLHGTSSAFRYANADPTATPQFLALYPLADLATPSSEELKAVPITHEIFPAPSHNASDVVEFRSRLYEHIQSYEPEDQPGIYHLNPRSGLVEL